MSLSSFDSFQSRFVTYLLNCPRIKLDWTSYSRKNFTYSDVGYPDRLGPSRKFDENCTKLTFLEITGYRIKYSTVLWLLELQISCGRKV
jgi:glycogen debranching enzyme